MLARPSRPAAQLAACVRVEIGYCPHPVTVRIGGNIISCISRYYRHHPTAAGWGHYQEHDSVVQGHMALFLPTLWHHPRLRVSRLLQPCLKIS